MTKKDFIRLLIKLIGILVLLNSLPMFIGQLAFFGGENAWEMIIWMVLVLIFTIAFSCWLIFYPDTIINFFKLDKGFDDNEVKIDEIKAEKLISIAVLVVGGMFILHSFAPFFVNIGYKIYASVDQSQLFPSFTGDDNKQLFLNIIELCAGYLLITNYRRITHFLISRNQKNESV